MISEILNSYSLSLNFLKQQLVDVPTELWAAQPNGAVNHAAWTLGHLIYSAELIGGEMGLTPWLPSDWKGKYGTGSEPTDSREAYPDKEALVAMLDDAERRIRERVQEIGEAGLAELLPDMRFRNVFPSTGHAVLHILVAHTASHIGQLIVWRRLLPIASSTSVFL